MNNAPLTSRRGFLEQIFHFSLLFSAAGASLITMACSKSNNADSNGIFDQDGNCLQNGTEVDVQLTHTPNHSFTVSRDDINAGVEKTYILENNGSGHTHTLTLTSDEFNQLKNNIGLRKPSTTDSGHSHQVTVSCA